jgi:phage head maturation protease
MTTQLERVAVPPREELQRMAPFALRAAADVDGPDDGLTLDGWAAVFNREEIIDSWEGRFFEQLYTGSMRKSFRVLTPKVQFDHGTHPLIGSLPIGRATRVEEGTDPELAPTGGAHVIARLHDNWLIEPVRDAIRSGAVDGMSFRFTVLREEWRTGDGKLVKPEELADMLRRSWSEDVPDEELLHRGLKEVKVPELGPVVFPAYADTSVAVRSKVTIDLGHIHDDPEQRRMLARALFVADAAERSKVTFDDAQLDDEHPLSAEDESRLSEAQPLDGHPSETDDAQLADEHPSDPQTPAATLRDEIGQWVEFATQHVASIKKET